MSSRLRLGVLLLSKCMRVLVVDDDKGILLSLELLLQSEGISVCTASTPTEALAVAEREPFDICLLDLNYTKDTTSGREGLSLLSTLQARFHRKPIVVMTGWASIEGAVEAMRRGARDYLPKPWDNARLVAFLRNLYSTRTELAVPDEWDALAATSPAMQAVASMIEGVAFSDLPVLITGEHGTGKEVVARRIHAQSKRRGAFVAVNAGAFPDAMLESELFGHVRGAFTDAKFSRAGAFVEAADGTLFLDEVANMPPAQQAKLLRVTQDGQFRPLGASASQASTARVVSATNANLSNEVKEGRFRPDLFYRLNAIHIHVPPLRERREVIPILARRFVTQMADRHGIACPELDDDAVHVLAEYPWPGNVRELEHTMQRATLLASTSKVISRELLGLPAEVGSAPAVGRGDTLKDAERSLILNALERFPRDRAAAAKSVGLTRSSFYRRIQRLGIKLDR